MNRPGISTRVFIWLSFFVLCYGLVYSFLYMFFGAWTMGWTLLISVSVFTPLKIWLELKGSYRAARYFFILDGMFYVTLARVLIPYDVKYEYFFIPCVLLPFMFFDAGRKIDLIIGGLIPIFAWALRFIIPSPELTSYWRKIHFPNEYFTQINFIGSYVLSTLMLVYFVQYLDDVRQDAIHDIKEMQKKLEEQRVLSMHSAKLASLGEVSAGVAHEINNPLAVVSAHIQLMHQDETLSEKIKKSLAAIDKAIDRIVKIITGLKKFSATNLNKEYEIENLDQVVVEAISYTDFKAKRHKVKVSYVNKVGEAKVLCDDVELQQVLINLINNAIDAVADKSNSWVEVILSKDANKYLIFVRDSGLGLNEEIAQKIFQPFFTTKGSQNGTGLGLSISRGIIEEHGGQLTLINEDKHTCFEVRLPAVM